MSSPTAISRILEPKIREVKFRLPELRSRSSKLSFCVPLRMYRHGGIAAERSPCFFAWAFLCGNLMVLSYVKIRRESIFSSFHSE